MIDQLSLSLRALLADPAVSAVTAAAEVSFDAPTDAFRPDHTTISLYLFDVREDAGLRDNVPDTELRAGVVILRKPPIRVICLYLVTVWIAANVTGDQAQLQQQQLLGEVFKVFSATPIVDTKYVPAGTLSAEYPITLSILQDGLMRNPSEFWSALGGKLRPSVTLSATIALEFDAKPVTAHQVTSKRIDLQGTEALYQIGGTVRADAAAGGAALEGVELTLVELGLRARSNAAGQFTFSGVSEGSYALQARKQGYVSTPSQVQVPGDSPTAFDLLLQLSP